MHAPPVHLLEVRVATGVDAEGDAVLEAVDPAGSTRSVLSVTTLRLRFDRFLLPSSVIRQAVCFQPFVGPPPEGDPCPGAVFLEPTYDPVGREVLFRLGPGETLRPSTRYQLTLLTPTEERPFGFRAFDGAPLEAPVVLQFETAEADPPGAAPEPLPDGVDLFCSGAACRQACEAASAVAACRAACGDCGALCGDCDPASSTCDEACEACATCARGCSSECTSECPTPVSATLAGCSYGGCHAPIVTAEASVGAAAGLDMSTPESIALFAIGKTAHQTQTGEHADEPDRQPPRFGRAMPIVDPLLPGNSYLLYKLLAHEAHGAPPDEIARLRGSVVVGMPMPAPPSVPLPARDLEAISDWIAAGAPTGCP